MSQAQGMLEEKQVGGAKRMYLTTTLKTILGVRGRDGPKEGILRDHCEKMVVEAISKDKVREVLFKMPKVPKKTPEKKGKAKDEGKEGDGEGGLKGNKVCA